MNILQPTVLVEVDLPGYGLVIYKTVEIPPGETAVAEIYVAPNWLWTQKLKNTSNEVLSWTLNIGPYKGYIPQVVTYEKGEKWRSVGHGSPY